MVRMGWSQRDYVEADESFVDAMLEYLHEEAKARHA